MRRTLFAVFTGAAVLFGMIHASGQPALAGSAGYLGVQVQELNDALRQALDFEGDGVLVNEVFDESPAARAGLEAGDIITRYDGEKVESLSQFVSLVREGEPGTEVRISAVRKGDEKEFTATVGEREARERFGRFDEKFKGMKKFRMEPRAYLGVRIESLGPQLGEYFATEDGALVLSVEEETPAAQAGLTAGDVIKEIDGSRIHDTEDVFEILEHRKAGDEVTVTVLRKGRHHDLQVTLGECPRRGGWHGGHPGCGRFMWQGPGGEQGFGFPDMGELDIELEKLDDLLDDEELSKAIEEGLSGIGPMTEKKMKALEKGIAELRGELEKLKEKYTE